MANPLPKDIQPAFPQYVPRGQARTKLLEVLGLDDLPESVDFTIEDQTQDEDIRSSRVSYVNSLSETLSAVVLMPLDSAQGKTPGVVCMHGTGGLVEKVVSSRLRLEDPRG